MRSRDGSFPAKQARKVSGLGFVAWVGVYVKNIYLHTCVCPFCHKYTTTGLNQAQPRSSRLPHCGTMRLTAVATCTKIILGCLERCEEVKEDGNP